MQLGFLFAALIGPPTFTKPISLDTSVDTTLQICCDNRLCRFGRASFGHLCDLADSLQFPKNLVRGVKETASKRFC